MRSLADSNTAIFISHRLYSTKFCDRIIFFENGHVSEMGTHDELMAKRGPYYQMFNIQAQYYEKGNENDL